MATTSTQGNGFGGGGGFPPPPPSNLTDPFPSLTIATVSLTAFVTQPTTIISSQTISTTGTVTPTPLPTLDLDETTALLQSNAAFTKTAFIIIWSLAGFAVFLNLLLVFFVVFFFFWIRHRRKPQSTSPPPSARADTPTAPQPSQLTRTRSTPLPMTREGRETYLSMGPQTPSSSFAHGAQALQSHSPSRPPRPPSSQTIQPHVPSPRIPSSNFPFPASDFKVPQTNIQPNIPSTVPRDHSSSSPPVSPITPVRRARSPGVPLFYSDIGHERDERREREEWLGVPTPQEQRRSTSTMASESILGITHSEDEENDKERSGAPHSTRASSATFPG